ncbi:hypothetical protein SAMN04488097_2136 [Epilithonimonas lactis]|nr:hypothetical protein SAMN04488097_2136 [Epilithonimonas lactis]
MKKTSSLKLLSLFVFVLYISCTDPSKESDKKIDALIYRSRVEMISSDYLKTLKYAKDAEVLALKTNKQKLPDIYLQMADAMSGLEFHRESLSYLNKILKMDFDKKDKVFKARVYQIFAFNYEVLQLKTQFLAYNQKAIKVLHDTKTYPGQFFLSESYGDIGYYYYTGGNTDSSFYYYKKKEAILKQFPKKHTKIVVNNLSEIYNIKGYVFLEYTKKKDSALFYFHKGFDLKKKYNHNILVREYLAFGDYYFLEKNYQKALEYYLKAEVNVSQQKTKVSDDNDVNKVLADTYEALGEPSKQSYYLEKYTKFNDSLRNIQKKSVDLAVSNMVKKQEEETSSVKNNYSLVIWIISFAIFISAVYIYLYLRKRNIDADQTEIQLTEKEFENQKLKQKVNESFEEVVQLAKDNHPEFLTRFQEVYPDYYQKLGNIQPKLLMTEMKLCAMIFLGFSTKDIAEYTFVTIKAAQHRKFRLRKKLNIPSDMDIHVWLSEV